MKQNFLLKKKKANEVHNIYTFESNNQGRLEILDEWNEGRDLKKMGM